MKVFMDLHRSFADIRIWLSVAKRFVVGFPVGVSIASMQKRSQGARFLNRMAIFTPENPS